MAKAGNQDVIRQHIVITPGTCGGKPRIAGHRIRVQDVAEWHERWGWSPDEVVAHYPQLTLANVHAALAYYWDHRQAIRDDIAAEERLVEEMQQQTPSLLKAKLEGFSHRQDSVPPRRKRRSGGSQRATRPGL